MERKADSSERGQVLVLLVLGIVGLMGFAALAIDGGMLFAERRAAQNAADSAVLAAAREVFNGSGTSTIQQSAIAMAGMNGYALTADNVAVNGPVNTPSGSYHIIEVTITSTVQTAFAHFVFGDLQNTVQASARFSAVSPPMAGFAIVTLGDCRGRSGSNAASLGVAGGGTSGGILTYDGGMFINTPETSANHCAIDPPNNGDGIRVMTNGHTITSVGSHTYAGASMISPVPVQTGFNGGQPITDPLASLPMPTCSSAGYQVGSTYYPGNWNGGSLGGGTYMPGIYCISGNKFQVGGNDSVTAHGVVFAFTNTGMVFTGNGNLDLSGPTTDNCTGTRGQPTSSCTYIGIPVFSRSSGNNREIEVGGNGVNRIQGTVYIPNTIINAHGGGESPWEALIWGQVIADQALNDGSGSLDVWYREDLIYRFPPNVQLEK